MDVPFVQMKFRQKRTSTNTLTTTLRSASSFKELQRLRVLADHSRGTNLHAKSSSTTSTDNVAESRTSHDAQSKGPLSLVVAIVRLVHEAGGGAGQRDQYQVLGSHIQNRSNVQSCFCFRGPPQNHCRRSSREMYVTFSAVAVCALGALERTKVSYICATVSDTEYRVVRVVHRLGRER